MLPTGTRVPVTIGDNGRLTNGQELVVVTVLLLSANCSLEYSSASTYLVFTTILHLVTFGSATGAGAAAARPTTVSIETRVNFILSEVDENWLMGVRAIR